MALPDHLETSDPASIIEYAVQQHERPMISFSGAEDVVLVDLACNLGVEVEVFCLDTGRLFPETYAYIERVREFYGIEIEMLSPDHAALESFVREKGLFSFYRDGHEECCSIRKIASLSRHLTKADAWITGQRRDQSPTRTEVPVVQVDEAFSGDQELIKYNPLASWSSAQVWRHIRENDVPYNPLHDRGYVSIGCEPCTRPVGPNQHERAGRWWWEEETQRECGLHAINLK